MESEIRGYHVYGSSRKPKIGDFLLTDRQVSNLTKTTSLQWLFMKSEFDGKKIVGHLPVEFSRIVAYFIENDGEISCKVTGKRKHSKGPRGGMAIPCKLCWLPLNKRHVKKLDGLIVEDMVSNNWKPTLKCQYSEQPWDLLHINEVSKRLKQDFAPYIQTGVKCDIPKHE